VRSTSPGRTPEPTSELEDAGPAGQKLDDLMAPRLDHFRSVTVFFLPASSPIDPERPLLLVGEGGQTLMTRLPHGKPRFATPVEPEAAPHAGRTLGNFLVKILRDGTTGSEGLHVGQVQGLRMGQLRA